MVPSGIRALAKLTRGSGAQASGCCEGDSLRGPKTRRAAVLRRGSPLFGGCRILAESKALKTGMGRIALSLLEARRLVQRHEGHWARKSSRLCEGKRP
jgi:hypothetical protein